MDKKIAEIVESSLANAQDYNSYRTLVGGLVEEGKTTGENQTEKLVAFTKLNEHRMKRLDKTIKLTSETETALDKIKCNLTWVVITEGWCGDAAQIMPALNKITENSSNIDLKVVLRDENLELMDQFLTNGGRSIPKVIIWDNDNKVVRGDWGPRPGPAQEMVWEYKNDESDEKKSYEEFQIELQKWYTKDKAETIQKELLPFMSMCE